MCSCDEQHTRDERQLRTVATSCGNPEIQRARSNVPVGTYDLVYRGRRLRARLLVGGRARRGVPVTSLWLTSNAVLRGIQSGQIAGRDLPRITSVQNQRGCKNIPVIDDDVETKIIGG